MYRFTVLGLLIRDDGVSIPADPGNIDYIAYLQWVSEGNMATPYKEPPIDYQAQLDAFESATLMNRLTREFMIASMQDMATRQAEVLTKAGKPTTRDQVLGARPGWGKLIEADAEATRLRGLL